MILKPRPTAIVAIPEMILAIRVVVTPKTPKVVPPSPATMIGVKIGSADAGTIDAKNHVASEKMTALVFISHH